MLKGILAIVIGFLLVKAFCDTVFDISIKYAQKMIKAALIELPLLLNHLVVSNMDQASRKSRVLLLQELCLLDSCIHDNPLVFCCFL